MFVHALCADLCAAKLKSCEHVTQNCMRRAAFAAPIRFMSRGPTMRRGKVFAMALLCVSASFVISCGSSGSGARNTPSGEKNEDKNVLNVYIWADYLAPDTISAFEKLTGIKVRVSYFENNETLEARMLTGNSGFDVVVPTAAFLKRQIRCGAFLPLDKKQLPKAYGRSSRLRNRIHSNAG
jgi:spermidine/putrescine-binding protein